MLDVLVRLDGWAAATAPSVEGLDDTNLWYLNGIDGWWSSGPVESKATARLSGDGSRGRYPRLASRVITLNGSVIADSEEDLAKAGDRFTGLLTSLPRSGEFMVEERYRSLNRVVTAELNGESLFARTGTNEANWSLNLVAHDPLKYSAQPTVLTTSRFMDGGGITFPITFPITFTSAGASGVLQANNLGTMATYPTFRLIGPLTNPRIRLRGGEMFELLTTMPSGQVIDVDMRNRTVLLGEASQRSRVSFDSRFFSLPAGGSDVLFDSDAGAGTCTMTYRSAWS